jgi:hypothetical protein
MFLGGMILLVVAALLVSKSSLVSGITRDGFASYYLQNAGGAKESYNKMGPFDAVGLTCPDGVGKWKCNTPNEPLNGPAFEPGPDSLFMFKNNQCKPSCCPSSYTCDGGCVCSICRRSRRNSPWPLANHLARREAARRRPPPSSTAH